MLINYSDRPNASPEKGEYDSRSSSLGDFANYPKFLLSFPSPANNFKNDLKEAMTKQRQQATDQYHQTQKMGTIQEEEKEPTSAAQQREPLNEPTPILQAKTIEEYLQIAFDSQKIPQF